MPQAAMTVNKLKVIFGILLVCAATTLLFQNCGQVRIERVQEIASTKPFGGSFCASDKYYMSSFYAVNLTGRFEGGRFKSDSDMDGVSDDDEIKSGTDPRSRRSNNLVLDQICRMVGGADRCLQLASDCTITENALGLNNCDVKVLELDRLNAGHPDQGADTDRDGIVDVVEILMNTNPNMADTTSDPDGDTLTNETELSRGSEVDYPDAQNSDFQNIQIQQAQLEDCATSGWQFSVSNLKVIGTEPYTDSNNPDLSHAANENIFLIYYKLSPIDSAQGPAQIWGSYLRIPYTVNPPDIDLQPSDFKLLGRVAP